jgi:antitoxin component of MazEF toxin-antitoxin module
MKGRIEMTKMTLPKTMRSTGGSSMLTIPGKIMDLLGWKSGDALRLPVSGRKVTLVKEPPTRSGPNR